MLTLKYVFLSKKIHRSYLRSSAASRLCTPQRLDCVLPGPLGALRTHLRFSPTRVRELAGYRIIMICTEHPVAGYGLYYSYLVSMC